MPLSDFEPKLKPFDFDWTTASWNNKRVLIDESYIVAITDDETCFTKDNPMITTESFILDANLIRKVKEYHKSVKYVPNKLHHRFIQFHNSYYSLTTLLGYLDNITKALQIPLRFECFSSNMEQTVLIMQFFIGKEKYYIAVSPIAEASDAVFPYIIQPTKLSKKLGLY